MGRWQPLLEQLARERYGRLLSLALLVAPLAARRSPPDGCGREDPHR